MPSAIASCGACKNGWGFSQPDEKEVSCTYEGYTSTMHTKRAYSRFFCPECGDMLSGNPMEVVYSEAHKFDGNGRCVCGYIATLSNTCKHETYGFGYESGGFEKKDASGHNERVLCWYQCWICGYEWREFAWTEYKAHTFDSNGRCSACGYTSSSSGSCKHTNKKSEKVGSVSKQYDDKYHETIVTYRDVCADCNAVLSAERKDTNKFDHRFDANGTCFCGYVQAKRPCDHTPTETLKDTKYGKADINGHEVIKTYHYECECKQVSYDEKKTSVGAHDYNRNTCRLCGFEKECEHPDFENVVSTAVEKNPNSASMHIIVTTYAEKCFCGAANPNPVKRTAEACRFIKNADVQSVHEKQGHQYVDKCECGNEKANGKFKAYVSGCADCKHFYDQCVLSRGNASNIPEKVKELQELLMRSGYDLPYYGADGDFSRETEKAVEKFQKDHGLPVTGVVDEATWNALKNTLNYTDTLSKGNPSNKTHVVKELQELLIKNGYELPYYGADGDFSRETEKAVKKFQKDHGLPETGVVDEATWAMLRNPDGAFETDAPSHGPMEGLTDDNPSHSSAETLPPKADSDDDTEGTPSHAPMEGIDEGEPDHGTMEGIEDDSPSHSFDATLPPKIEDESEVVIDGSFGKASYTAEIGDTLSISVRAGSENANLERVTINVDGSGVDRLASEAISGTAWSGTLPLNCSAYPLNTPGTYTLKLYVSADAGDPNWAIVDYATLVVNDAPVKPDKPVVNVAIDGNTMTATWNAVDGADRYVYSLYNITDDYRIVQHASANKRSASAALEAGKQYRIAVAAVPAGVVDTETEADKCSWAEVVFTVGTIEEPERPVVLSVTPDMTGKILLPGEKVTFTITCNSTTVRLDVYDADYRTLYNPYIDSANCVCFTYEAAYSANGKYQLRFVALDAQGQWSVNTADYGYANIVVCDHTTVRSDVPESTIVEKKENDGSHHYVVKTYYEQCACGEINKPIVDRETVKCSWTVNAGVQSRHDTNGHQRFNRCNEKNCRNAYTNGSFVSYLASCSTCQEMYGKDALAQGNRNNDEGRVKELQELLEQNGYDLPKYGADGDFGGETASAVERFQRDHGLPVTGVVDDETWVKLVAVHNQTSVQQPTSNLTNTVAPESSAENKVEIDTSEATKVSSIDTTILDIATNGAFNSDVSTGVLEFAHDPSSALKFEYTESLNYTKQIITDMLQSKASSINNELLDTVNTYGTCVGLVETELNGIKSIYSYLSTSKYVSDGADFAEAAGFVDDVAKGLKYGGYVVSAVASVIEANEVENMLESERAQLKAIVEDAYNYEVSMRTLDQLIASTNGDLRTACMEVRAELQASFDGNYVTLSSYKNSVNKKASLVFNAAVGLTPVGLVFGGYSSLTPGIDGLIKAQDRLVDVAVLSSSAYSSLEKAAEAGDESTIALFDLYCAIQMAGFEATGNYYSSYAETFHGSWNEFWGITDVDSVLRMLENEKNNFIDEAEEIRNDMCAPLP